MTHFARFSAVVSSMVFAITASSLSAQTVARVVVTPSPASVVAGESLQLKAEAVDKDGRPVSGIHEVETVEGPDGGSFGVVLREAVEPTDHGEVLASGQRFIDSGNPDALNNPNSSKRS